MFVFLDGMEILAGQVCIIMSSKSCQIFTLISSSAGDLHRLEQTCRNERKTERNAIAVLPELHEGHMQGNALLVNTVTSHIILHHSQVTHKPPFFFLKERLNWKKRTA